MSAIFAVAAYTLKEHIRHRTYLTIALFGLVLVGSAAIVSSLAVEERVRMLTNAGLGGVEFLSLIAVVFVTVNLVLDEIESRSIYLVLSHPVERWQYIVGRYAGTLLALAFGILAMAIMHVATLLLHGWRPEAFYPVALACVGAKIAVVGGLALFISLATTSTASSMTITGFLWVLGHFGSELSYMAERSANPITKGVVWLVQQLAPDFARFNYRDFWHAAVAPPPAWFGWMALYATCYVAVVLFLSSWLFSRKEV